MVEYQCKQCEDKISGSKPWRKTYCSRQCAGIAKRDTDTSTCPNCGDRFEHNPSVERLYCSTGCYNQANKSGTDNPQYIDGRDDSRSYGPNWSQQREAALERDFHRCRVCNVADSNLAVHHRTPIRMFDDKKKANRLRNLLTVCPRCHGKLEHEIHERGDSPRP